MNDVALWVGIALLGGAGACARFIVHRAITRRDPSEFPLGTFIVNAAGAFLLGLLAGAAAGHDLRLLAGTGFLGAFTTFSTWMYESERLVADGYARGAAINVALSTAIGFALVAAGVAVGGAL